MCIDPSWEMEADNVLSWGPAEHVWAPTEVLEVCQCVQGSWRNLHGYCDPRAQQHGGNRRRVGHDLAAVPLSRMVALFGNFAIPKN